MIKLNYNTVKSEDNKYIVNSSGCIEGERDELIAEIRAIFESLEKKFPDLFMEALYKYLKTKGF